jgi:hypothetical protein
MLDFSDLNIKTQQSIEFFKELEQSPQFYNFAQHLHSGLELSVDHMIAASLRFGEVKVSCFHASEANGLLAL